MFKKIPECVVFDLDNTLTKSKQPIEEPMLHTLSSLLKNTNVAITSGGKLEQLIKQVAEKIPDDNLLGKLFLLPTSGAALYVYENKDWKCIYEDSLSPEEVEDIGNAIRFANDKTHTVDFNQQSYGERIEFRGAQISFSALGQKAPLEEKIAWDPTRAKREAFLAMILPLLKAYTVRIGGTTTIDITKKGIDKAYGIKQLSKYLSIPINRMLYVGDELGPAGNDEVVIKTGIETRTVTNPDDTEHFIKSLLLRI